MRTRPPPRHIQHQRDRSNINMIANRDKCPASAAIVTIDNKPLTTNTMRQHDSTKTRKKHTEVIDMDKDLKAHCQQAIKTLHDCLEREQRQYGDEHDRVAFMEHEAPAPDPCVETYNELLETILKTDEPVADIIDTLELGELRARVMGDLSKAQS